MQLPVVCKRSSEKEEGKRKNHSCVAIKENANDAIPMIMNLTKKFYWNLYEVSFECLIAL